MAQSLSKIYVHLIFSTKNRERTLPDEIRPDLHAYMGGTLKGLGEHHRVKSFQEELRAFLKAYEVEFDERYVWD